KCGDSKVSARYFIVEMVNGAAFGAIWYVQFCQPMNVNPEDIARAIGYFIFAAALVAAIFTDLAHYIIPDEINAAMFIVGVGVNIALVVLKSPGAWEGNWAFSLVGALTGIAVIWGIAFFGRLAFRKDAMGHGDIKMARGIGAVLGMQLALGSFALAVVLGAVFGIIQVMARKKQPEPDVEEEDDEPYEPESLGSLLWCGLGYVLCVDIIGLVFPKLYEWWFKENPYAYEEIDGEPEVEHTMIPFGPYLAAGALVAMVFQKQLLNLGMEYWRSVGPSK
ncbi:MAG: A24 family peptidase, partial [Armatimonadota bacterium]